MANEKFKVKYGLAVGDTSAGGITNIDGTTGEATIAAGEGGQILIGAGVGDNGRIELGLQGRSLAGTPYIDFHSVANSGDYDVRILASGGNSGTPGEGDLTVTANSVIMSGDVDVKGGNIQNSTGDLNINASTGNSINLNAAANPIVATRNTTLTNSATRVVTLRADSTGTPAVGFGGVLNFEVETSASNFVQSGYVGTTATDISAGNEDFKMIFGVTNNGTVATVAELDNLGNLQIDGDLDVQGASITNSTGALTIATTSNGDISLTPDGAGRTNITRASTTSPRITTSIDDTNGNELLLLTATASAVNELTLANAATGANPTITASGGDTNVGINITAKGTGDMALTFNDGGNLTNTRNYVFGAIRNANTESRGNMWELLATVPPTAPTGQFQGITIDNSISGKNAAMVLRNYGATGPARARFIFERSRGTAASPSQVVNGDFLGEIGVSGYTGAGWINDNVALVPAFFGFAASETWTGTSNVGTLFALSLQPTATTLATGSQINTFVSAPERFQLRSDQFCIGRGKTTAWTATGSSITGTTLTIGTLTTGTIAVGQQVTGSTLQAGTYIVANLTGSGSGSTWTVSQSQTTGSITMQGVTGYLGTDTTGTTTDVLSDLRLIKNTIKGSSGTTQITTSAAGATLALAGDTITLESSSGTDYLVLNNTDATFSKPVKLNGSTSGSVTLSAGATPAAQTYTLPSAYPTVNNQVLVSTTGGTMSWATSGGTAANYLDSNYTATIGAITANTIYGIPVTSISANNITIATGTIAIDNATATGPTRITFAQTGRYNLQFSIQLENADNAADHTFDIWLRKNGTDVADTNTQYTILKNNGKVVAALNLLLNPTVVNDYYELVYAVNNANVGIKTIAAQTTPYAKPQTPGIIVTVVPVGA